MENEIIIAVSNQYIMKYYCDEILNDLTEELKENIKLMLVKYTEECGGIVELIYNTQFNDLSLLSIAEDEDFTYDEIEANFKLSKLEREYQDFFKELAIYIKDRLEEKNKKEHNHKDCKCGCEHNEEHEEDKN